MELRTPLGSRLRGGVRARHLDDMDSTQSAITDLEMRVAAMRRLGVTRWADIELGAVPVDPGPNEDMTQRSELLERTKAEREKRVRFGASGGPRPALVRT